MSVLPLFHVSIGSEWGIEIYSSDARLDNDVLCRFFVRMIEK